MKTITKYEVIIDRRDGRTFIDEEPNAINNFESILEEDLTLEEAKNKYPDAIIM